VRTDSRDVLFRGKRSRRGNSGRRERARRSLSTTVLEKPEKTELISSSHQQKSGRYQLQRALPLVLEKKRRDHRQKVAARERKGKLDAPRRPNLYRKGGGKRGLSGRPQLLLYQRGGRSSPQPRPCPPKIQGPSAPRVFVEGVPSCLFWTEP